MFTTLLSGWRPVSPPPARRLPRAAPPAADPPMSDPVDADARPFCGWYESSRDLWAGIDLREMAWSDADGRRQRVAADADG